MWPLSNIHASKILERQFFKPSFGFFFCTFLCFIAHLKQMCTHYRLVHTFVYLPTWTLSSSIRCLIDKAGPIPSRSLSWNDRWSKELTESKQGEPQTRELTSNLHSVASAQFSFFLLATWKITWSNVQLCVGYNLSSHIVASLTSRAKELCWVEQQSSWQPRWRHTRKSVSEMRTRGIQPQEPQEGHFPSRGGSFCVQWAAHSLHSIPLL